MSSWLKSLIPTEKWVLYKHLRNPGSIWSKYLKGIKDHFNFKNDSSLEEADTVQRLEDIEKIIGYNFNNRTLLHEAFTYPSYHRGSISYERLEYIGDSVLNFLITKEQFYKYPNLPPGLLTPLRAANVDTEKLARVAIQRNFHRYIRLNNPIIRKQIRAFVIALPKHPLHSHGLINAPKVLADVVESTLGAVFVDSNCSMEKTWEVASDLLKPIITPETLRKNPVKKLNEICQKYKLKVRVVDQWAQEGTYKVFVNNKLKGKGVCHEKKEIALNRAANDAYKEVLRSIESEKVDDGLVKF